LVSAPPGGATEIAQYKEIFVIRANGSVVAVDPESWFGHDVSQRIWIQENVVVVRRR